MVVNICLQRPDFDISAFHAVLIVATKVPIN